ncbi:hypothetical protein BJV82DRAFT_605279 [Fennellomyces sp. T-0311]|nr:hypothetical protein BJV82DRAFT_605279 [Fennellomyces sp. T-0311]
METYTRSLNERMASLVNSRIDDICKEDSTPITILSKQVVDIMASFCTFATS